MTMLSWKSGPRSAIPCLQSIMAPTVFLLALLLLMHYSPSASGQLVATDTDFTLHQSTDQDEMTFKRAAADNLTHCMHLCKWEYRPRCRGLVFISATNEWVKGKYNCILKKKIMPVLFDSQVDRTVAVACLPENEDRKEEENDVEIEEEEGVDEEIEESEGSPNDAMRNMYEEKEGAEEKEDAWGEDKAEEEGMTKRRRWRRGRMGKISSMKNK
ncbi:hypothetical protein CBR_g36732 [Chara braunii]|uniref:Apple domain-containing protein n=1 Tax=Chara braunii TaxID=69332 RepID=A0A388LLD1_CHABU|nr:hypothetical protein CBR_g36732 [Chara braunii]|eukprot:GBG83114.1 hypothetical protein CBR_g36732 [Chara braunii]